MRENIGESDNALLQVLFRQLFSILTPRTQISSCYHFHLSFLKKSENKLKEIEN
jgi:hypothetical protein